MSKTFLFVGYSQNEVNKRLNTIRRVDSILGEEKPNDVQCDVARNFLESGFNPDGTTFSFVKYMNKETNEYATYTLIIVCKNRAETIKPYNYILQGEDLLMFSFAVLASSGLSQEEAISFVGSTNLITSVLMNKKDLMEFLIKIDGFKKEIAA